MGSLIEWHYLVSLMSALVAQGDSRRASIYSKLDILSYMQLFSSNSQQVILHQSQKRQDWATSLGSNENSSVTSYQRFLNTLQQLPQNPYPYWFLVTSSASSVSMTFSPLSSITSMSTFFSFFSSFFPSCFLFNRIFDNRLRFSKNSPLVFFSKYTVSICLSWLYTALEGSSAIVSGCQKARLRRQGLRQNLNSFSSMQNSQAVTLTQGRRRLRIMWVQSWVSLNSGISMGVMGGLFRGLERFVYSDDDNNLLIVKQNIKQLFSSSVCMNASSNQLITNRTYNIFQTYKQNRSQTITHTSIDHLPIEPNRTQTLLTQTNKHHNTITRIIDTHNIKQPSSTLSIPSMQFFQQYRDLFQVNSNVPQIPYQRLRLDNELFIERPFIPTYTQEHSLNSKLRQLKKDYNEFQSQVRDLEDLEEIPQRSQSRRKQHYNREEGGGQVVGKWGRGGNGGGHNDQRKAGSGGSNGHGIGIANNGNGNNTYSYKKHHQQSTIFDHYQENKSQFIPQKQFILQRQLIPQKQLTEQQYQNQSLSRGKTLSQHNSISNNYPSQSPHSPSPSPNNHLLLQSLRHQNQQNTSRLIKNQNLLKNKFYQDTLNSDVLKQSEINHVFNWKLEKQSSVMDRLESLPERVVPKYNVRVGGGEEYGNGNSSSNNYNSNGNGGSSKNFAIRSIPSSTDLKPIGNNHYSNNNTRNNNNNSKNNTSAQQRRRIAKQNIDQRREKLKMIIKAYF